MADGKRKATPRKREKAPAQKKVAAPKAPKSPRRAPAARHAGAAAPAARRTKERAGGGLRLPSVAPRGEKADGLQPRQRRLQHQRGQALRTAGIVAACVAALALVGVVALFVLRNTSAFEITSIEVEPTEHVSAESVQSLAQVPAGSTLLNVDTDAIEEALRKNPWVASVDFDRRFPSTLGIRIQEQRVDALVLMSSGAVAWYLSDQGTWIEPVMVEPAEGQSSNDAALAIARDNGCLLITDVPATVEPSAGAEATDATLDAVAQFREGFSSDFDAQIVCFRAPSPEGISCVLESGVEVSLGAPTDIAEKERIVEGYLAEHEGGLLLINVRVPSSPAYRELSSDNLTFGSGVNPEEEPEETPETDE